MFLLRQNIPDTKRYPGKTQLYKIPLIRPRIGKHCKERVMEVLDSGHLTEGSVTHTFENTVRQFVGVTHCLATTSCSTGLDMALHAIGVAAGDEVIVPDYTYPATAAAVRLLGATPVIVDVDPQTMLVDYAALEAAITPATKALLPVSLFGNPLDADRLAAIKNHHEVWIVEDAACSLGASYKGRLVGGLADITVFSLHPRKILTTGEGGLVVTEDAQLAEFMDSYKHFGLDMHHSTSPRDATFLRIGSNYKMSDILAAVGLGQMEEIDNILKERRFLAKRYEARLAKIPDITLPRATFGGEHAYQSFCIFLENRNQIMDTLREQGIEVQIGTYALHRQPAFRDDPDCRVNGSCTNSDWVFDHCLALPLFHGMTFAEQDQVVEALCQSM
jgi:dTDP-4-amino-4,6-dideoxygalactose transaminase